MFTQTNTHSKRGFTLVETLFYIAGMVALLVVIIFMLINSYDWYRTTVVYPRADQDGSLAISRIENDIKSGSSLNTAQNSFNTTSGSIGVTGLDSTGTSVTYYYALQGGRITYQKNGGATEYITPAYLTVTRLQFNQIDTPISTAIRTVIDITYSTKTGTTTNTYSSLSIMRNTYE
jgi:hypothetical protein